MKHINIAREFSETPMGRYHPTDGPDTGQRFREDFLVPALKQGPVTVDIDGTEGYGSSFLDEAFGGLVYESGFTAKDLHERLTIQGVGEKAPAYRKLIWEYIEEAKPAVKA